MEHRSSSPEALSLPKPFTNGPEVYQLTEEEERQRSNALQLAWAMSRFSGTDEEKIAAALDWLTSSEGEAVSEWFRQAVINYQDPTGKFARRIHFLKQVSPIDGGGVPEDLLQELNQLYRTRSIH